MKDEKLIKNLESITDEEFESTNTDLFYVFLGAICFFTIICLVMFWRSDQHRSHQANDTCCSEWKVSHGWFVSKEPQKIDSADLYKPFYPLIGTTK